MRRHVPVLVHALLVTAMSAAARAQTIYYVDDDAAVGGDGLTWLSAYDTLPPALSAAQPGDQVWVAAGTYVGNFTLGAEVEMYGGFAGDETDLSQRDWTINETILDGNQAGTVLSVAVGLTAATRIDGFTITGGNTTDGGGVSAVDASPTIANNVITNNVATDQGGGVYLSGSSAALHGNTITGNSVGGLSQGGGVSAIDSSPSITDNQITDNFAYERGGGIYVAGSTGSIQGNTIDANRAGFVAFGAGICLLDSSTTITNNVITNNQVNHPLSGATPAADGRVGGAGGGRASPPSGGGLAILANSSPRIEGNLISGNGNGQYGGGLYVVVSEAGSPTIIGNTISGNDASDIGGGIRVYSDAPMIIAYNTIVGNSTDGHGGGIYLWSGPIVVANNLIIGNTASAGGGVYVWKGDADTIANNTIVGNTAGSGGGLYREVPYGDDTLTVANTIIAFNSSGLFNEPGAAPALRYNCVFGNTAYDYSGFADPTGTDGNISIDPLLRSLPSPGPDGTWGTNDDDYGDVSLSGTSPAIDAGDNGEVPPDLADLDGDGNTTEPIPFDVDGWGRLANAPLTPDTGSGSPPVVDIGAYEFQDCNGNGTADALDILAGDSTDANDNAVPDECDLLPRGEDSLGMTCSNDEQCGTTGTICVDGTCYALKNRYISIDPNPTNGGFITARRVSLYDAGGQHVVLGWVGEPVEVAVAGPETTPQLIARIENTPHYRDWALDNGGQPWANATVHVGDCETSPGRTYLIQSILEGLNTADEANYSAPLMLPTVADFGDVVGATPGLPPDGARNFKDISGVVRGFQSVQTEPNVWLDLQGSTAAPEVPDFSDINFADINQVVAGFQGGAYPFAAPCDCPGQSCP